MNASRRRALQALASAGLASLLPLRASGAAGARVVVVGGGFAGATAAKYLRLWDPGVSVTLVEANREFVSCPVSNRVIAGTMSLRDITRNYDGLTAHGVRVTHDTATDIDPVKRVVKLGRGESLGYDRLILAPGIDFLYDRLPGLESAAARAQVPHAWKAGDQTMDLRKRIFALRPGGVFAMHVPKAPYRCPPGPYERATMVAFALQRANPRAKVLVFDANPDVVAKRDQFRAVWESRYKGMIEYLPSAELAAVDAAAQTLKLEAYGAVKADVLNIIPPQAAGPLARRSGLVGAGGRWCEVDFLSYESKVAPGVHVIGDAVGAAPGMPKSGHMANQHGKVCAAAVLALLNGQPVNDEPIIINTCYSFVGEREVIHVTSVHRYDREKKTMVTVPGASGVSPQPNAEEGYLALAWAFNILNDTFG